MIKRITLALTFVAVLAVAGVGISSTAEAGHGHCGYGGGYGGGHGGHYASYGYAPAVSVGYGYAPVYSGYYGYGVPVRAYRPLPAVRTYPHHHSGFRLSIGF